MNTTIRLGDTLDLLARVTNDDGTYPTPQSITGITLIVTNTTTGQPVSTSVLTASGTVTPLPTLDDRWREDDLGYNFIATVVADTFATHGNYAVTVIITTTTTTALTWAIQVTP